MNGTLTKAVKYRSLQQFQLSSPERPRGQIKYTHFNFTHAIAVQRMQACARKLLSCSYFGTMYFQEFYDTVFCEKWCRSHKEM